MSRKNILVIAGAALIALGLTTGAQAEGGGGGNDRFNEAAAAAAKPAKPAAWQPRPGGQDFAESTYRDGTRIRSEGIPGGGRSVTQQGPKGKPAKKVAPAGEGPYAEAWGRDGKGVRSEGPRGKHNVTPINRARW